MNFVPDEKIKKKEVPYFEDVTKESGWAGQTTGKSEDALKAEISTAIGRLGGIVSSWIPGSFGVRNGFRIVFNLDGGKPGRIDIVALPLKTRASQSGYEAKKQQSIKMALFNLRDQLDSLWRMEQLVPGFFGLLPMMLANEESTIGELFIHGYDASRLLPSGEEDFIDAEYEKE